MTTDLIMRVNVRTTTNSRSPRRSGGFPRMLLLVFPLGFEPYVGRTSEFSCKHKTKQESIAESALQRGVGRRSFDASR